MSKIHTLNNKRVFTDRFFLSYVDEENWLNEKASEGFYLVKKSFYRYYFEQDTGADIKYSVELLEHPADNPLSAEYIEEKKKCGLDLVAHYKCRAYFRMASETYNAESENAKKTRIKSVASMLAVFLISYIASVAMLCYHCVSSLNFTVTASAEKMGAVTEEFPFFGFFEKLARLIKLDSVLGDYQSTPMALMFFIIAAVLAVPTAVYFRELFLIRRKKKPKDQREIKSEK